MNLGEAIVEALSSLTSNKLRSTLTILGIVIGVAAVIAMLAVGQGAQDTITGSINGIGTNLLFVYTGNTQQTIQNPKALTMADVSALSDPFQTPAIQAVAPVVQGSATVIYNGEDTDTTIMGVTSTYGTMRNYAMSEGEFITDENNLGQASVAVIGSQVAEKLFGRTDGIVGETIRIDGTPFRVIGVMQSKGGSSFSSEDNQVMIPLSTAQSRIIRKNVPGKLDMILIQATGAELVDQAKDQVSEVLRERHRTQLGADDFTVFSQSDAVSIANTVTGVLTIFLGGVAGISLLVGGIGIMNIMLVSVTERTREIGLRKALGARKRDILIQFLTESAMLSLFGGIIGIVIGYLLSMLVGYIAAASGTPFTPLVSFNAILLATLFSAAVGIFFGLYPANRAAGLQPVEALRYE
jgi:putative ABC transport system permease protein